MILFYKWTLVLPPFLKVVNNAAIDAFMLFTLGAVS